MANPTFAGTVLPDGFVGVPYLAGLPVLTALSQNITAVSVLTASAAPPGWTFNGAGYVTGTVLPAGITGSQVDGNYTFAVKITDAAGSSASTTMSVNIHYLQADQDLTVAEQAALRQVPFLNASAADASSFTQTPVATDAG